MQALKLFSSDRIKAWDAFSIREKGSSSAALMEKAAGACFVWLKAQFPDQKQYTVVCGPGNNGGDGLALARMLCGDKKHVKVFICKGNAAGTDDFLLNEKRLHEQGRADVFYLDTAMAFPVPLSDAVLIDALFGSGLNRPAEGVFADLIDRINSCGAAIVSIDIPSGLMADSSSQACMSVVKATYTLAFQMPKTAFFFPENEIYVPEWTVLDIGLSAQFYEEENCRRFLLDKQYIASLIKPRKRFAHKGQFGHCLLMAGSYGKAGAALLSASAALRSGCGLLTVYAPESALLPLQTSVPEAMVLTSPDFNFLSGLPDLSPYTAVAAGPGIGTADATLDLIQQLFQNAAALKLPLLLDADALNALSVRPSLLDLIPENSILTPHLKEFERFAGTSPDGFSRHRKQLDFSVKHKVYMLLKGRHSCLTCPDGSVYFNNSGNPGMAKGGSGDVLSGITGSLLAQGYSPKDAACIGMYVHGLSGDIAAAELGETAMKAGDLTAYLHLAFRDLESKSV